MYWVTLNKKNNGSAVYCLHKDETSLEVIKGDPAEILNIPFSGIFATMADALNAANALAEDLNKNGTLNMYRIQIHEYAVGRMSDIEVINACRMQKFDQATKKMKEG